MSLQSDAAKAWIEELLMRTYPREEDLVLGQSPCLWEKEYLFHPDRKWRFDYAVPAILCAKPLYPRRHVIELDGGTFQGIRSGHSSGVGLRNWREKNNAAMTAGWRVWHYAPEEVIKSGRKTLPDEPILRRLPWHESS